MVHYEGGDIPLATGPVLSLAEYPELTNYIGQDIIVSDGQSLLGADDKAAIAAILNALQFFKDNPDVEHGTVKVGFIPDEEQGLLGANAFDVDGFELILLTLWIAAVLVSLYVRTGMQVMRSLRLRGSLHTL